jgi:hypothetical protein
LTEAGHVERHQQHHHELDRPEEKGAAQAARKRNGCQTVPTYRFSALRLQRLAIFRSALMPLMPGIKRSDDDRSSTLPSLRHYAMIPVPNSQVGREHLLTP